MARERTLTEAEIRAFWHTEDLPSRNLLRALLLTGCRIAELQRAQTSHISGDWLTIPPAHSKNKRAHKVLLTPLTRAQFDGRKPLLFADVSPTAVQSGLRRWHTRHSTDAWTPHDLRRTFATIAGDLGVAPHVITKLPNHTMDGVTARYLRTEWEDEREAATKLLSAHINKLVAKKRL